MPLYQIGRSGRCDIVLGDRAVSNKHAELLALEDGRLYLSDCASRNGTKVWRRGEWRAVRQTFVQRNERVLFGTVQLTVAELLRKIPPRESAPGDGRRPAISQNSPPNSSPNSLPNSLPQGPVKRHPETGEIIPS